MQQFIKQRATLEGAITFETAAVDVSGASLLVHMLIVHGIGGTSPSLTLQPETSDDLEVWSPFGTSIALSATGQQPESDDVKSQPYGRYIRYKVTFAGTGNPNVTYSIVLNTHQSS